MTRRLRAPVLIALLLALPVERAGAHHAFSAVYDEKQTITVEGVVTLDRSDFSVYRRNGRDLIPLIAPPARRARP